MSLVDAIIRSEGYRKDPYIDQNKYWTGGYGHKILEADWKEFNPKWSDKEKKDYWLKKLVLDISIANKDIMKLTSSWKYQPNEPQMEVLVELDFNLGLKGLLGFKKFLDHFKKGEIQEAADELIDSKWHRDFVKWNSGRDTSDIRSRRLEKKLLDSI